MPFDQRDSWHLARSACAADWQANNRVVNFSGWAGQHGADGTCSCSCSTCTTYLTELKQPLAVQAIVRPWRLSHVVAELSKVGIYGLTATRVRGAGVQGGELRGGSVYLWAASPVSVQCQISACTLQQALGCKEAAKAIERMYSRLSAGLLPQASLSHTDSWSRGRIPADAVPCLAWLHAAPMHASGSSSGCQAAARCKHTPHDNCMLCAKQASGSGTRGQSMGWTTWWRRPSWTSW